MVRLGTGTEKQQRKTWNKFVKRFSTLLLSDPGRIMKTELAAFLRYVKHNVA